MHEKTIDRELGELTAMVRTLGDKVDALSKEFQTYRVSNDEANRRDYSYLDDKMGKLDRRITAIEEAHTAEKSGGFAKLKATFTNALVNGAGLAFLAFIGYLALEWAKTL